VADPEDKYGEVVSIASGGKVKNYLRYPVRT